MSILVKDHKDWSFSSGKPVPTRPIVSGNGCLNSHLSELVSEIIEPVVLEKTGAEIQSTEEALAIIDELNEKLTEGYALNNILKTLSYQLFINMSYLASLLFSYLATLSSNCNIDKSDIALFIEHVNSMQEKGE